MLLLVRRGGWRRQRHLRSGQPTEGRLWQRWTPERLGFHFSRHTLRFLLWTATAPLPSPKKAFSFPVGQVTASDWLFFYFVFLALRTGPFKSHCPRWSVFWANPFCRLVFPDAFADVEKEVPDFTSLVMDQGAPFLFEALQLDLSRHWERMEREKRDMRSLVRAAEVGREQERVLHGFLDAVEQVQRWDLARFFLSAYSRVLSAGESSYNWMGRLAGGLLRFAQRVRLYRAALGPLNEMERMRRWNDLARGVGYFDEGYAASQLWKEDWESVQGDVAVRNAASLVRRWESWR